MQVLTEKRGDLEVYDVGQEKKLSWEKKVQRCWLKGSTRTRGLLHTLLLVTRFTWLVPLSPLLFFSDKKGHAGPHTALLKEVNRGTHSHEGCTNACDNWQPDNRKSNHKARLGEQATLVYHQSLFTGTFFEGGKDILCTLFALLDQPASIWKKAPTLTLSSLAGCPWGHRKVQNKYRQQ